jgi:hypothetical protein
MLQEAALLLLFIISGPSSAWAQIKFHHDRIAQQESESMAF